MAELKPINYGYTFARLSKDSRIGFQAIAIYDVLSSLAGDEYKCTATVQELCEMLQMTPKTFFKYQNDLIAAGYLSKKRQGGHNGNVYTLELAKAVFKDIKRLYSKRLDSEEVLNLPAPYYFELCTGKKLTKDLIHLFKHYYELPNWAINYAISKALDQSINNPIEIMLYANSIAEKWLDDPSIQTKADVDEQEAEYYKQRQLEKEGWE
ncbi:hypothetical protein M3M39_06355 [Fructilactobacillus hinvesii]|uniref:Helix-turn-helix domain-containing protein n=1 Tax=Fructilactobacillus hinvesii TaxID=2940300 RepID=A0ABY5BVF4_9LACO|nr:hypothetical protein [Fructilactobacillus hinvesii]USS87724.1 hypothetical protein M3M39_06355 [Fructilactobacillus hinvesii]